MPFYSGQHIDTQCDVRTCCQGDGGRESLFYTPCLACAPTRSNYQSPWTPTRFLVRPNPISVLILRYFPFITSRVQSSPWDILILVGNRHSPCHTAYFRAYCRAICLRLLARTGTNTLGKACGMRHRPRVCPSRNFAFHFTAFSHHSITSTNAIQIAVRSKVALLLRYGEEMNRPNTQHQILSFLQLKFRYKRWAALATP